MYKDGNEFRRLCLMLNKSMSVTQIKRKIEEEFMELFSGEMPFLVGRVEDESGFVLSN